MGLSLLILGGTSQGRLLAARLRERGTHRALLSFAGRTASLADPGVPHRVGGFGGVEGLVTHLREGGYAALVDATHPFAARMSQHAAMAAARLGLPLARLELPPWQPEPGDRWTRVTDLSAALRALGPEPRRVLSTIGRQEAHAFRAAPQHDYLLRSVDAFEPGLPRARVLLSRGPFDVETERALLEREHIDVMVSKNSGTPATYAKIVAARQLRVPVVMLERPMLPEVETLGSVDAALAWLDRVHDASVMLRGV